MHFNCRSFIGKHSDFNWSQHWENEPDDINLVLKKGHLFGLINFSLDDGSSQINNLGKEIISKINDKYFNDTNIDILSSLRTTIEDISFQYSQRLIQLSLTVFIVHNKTAYFLTYNNGHVIFQRDTKISQLIYGQESQYSKISGPLFDGDKILLSTDDFYQSIGFSKIKSAIAEEKIQTIEEIFLSELYSQNNQPNLAALLIQIHDEKDFQSTSEFIPDKEVEELFQEDIKLNSLSPSTPHNLSIEKNSFSFNKFFSSKKDVFVSNRELTSVSKRRKINIIVALVLLIAFSVSIYFGYQKNQAKKAESEYQKLKIEIVKKVSDALAIKNLNLNSALVSAKEAEKILEKMTALKIHPEEIDSTRIQINSLLAQTGESPKTENYNIFADLSEQIPNSHFDKFIFSNNQLFLLDNITGTIQNLEVSTKKVKKNLSSDTLKNVDIFTQDNGNLYVLKNNVLYNIEKENVVQKLDFNTKSIKTKDISFWNGIIYVLDQSKSKIIKFTPNSSGYDNGTNWLKEGNNINQNATSLSINSSVWLVSETGQIESFTRGIMDPISFTKENLPTNGNKIIATISSGVIVINDKENNVYLYKTTGQVVGKYNFGDKKILDVVVNEKDNLVYVLCADQKIYNISL